MRAATRQLSALRSLGQPGLRSACAPAARALPALAGRSLSTASRVVVAYESRAFVRALQTSRACFDAQPAPSAWAKNPIAKYDEVKKISEQPSDDVLLVDVREPDEVALGSIPSAVNLPLSRLREALDPNFNPGDFQREFAFQKPTHAQKIIFFCRSGKRSASAGEWAGERGYKNVRNYEGSWLDWSAHEKQNGSEDD